MIQVSGFGSQASVFGFQVSGSGLGGGGFGSAFSCCFGFWGFRSRRSFIFFELPLDALSLTVRRHTFNKDSLSLWGLGARGSSKSREGIGFWGM